MSYTKFQILAKCYKGNRQIAVGMNNYTKSHPLQKHFAELVGVPDKQFLHAEIQALLRCKDTVPTTVTVERYDRQGNMKLAKPCKICSCALKKFGVRFVKFTSDTGWETLEVNNL